MICKKVLSTELTSLQKKIEDSVHNTSGDKAAEADIDEEDCDEVECDDDVDCAVPEGPVLAIDDEHRAEHVDSLIFRISNWQRPVPNMR